MQRGFPVTLIKSFSPKIWDFKKNTMRLTWILILVLVAIFMFLSINNFVALIGFYF
jgi:hypothetical protein